MSSRTSVRDLPEVQPFWLSPTVIERNAPLDRGAVAKRLRGRSLYFLLFCRVKREGENPFEIETHGSISSPRYPRPVQNGACGRTLQLSNTQNAPFAKHAMDPRRTTRRFQNWCRDKTMRRTFALAALFH